jgi:hypothetical protein
MMIAEDEELRSRRMSLTMLQPTEDNKTNIWDLHLSETTK